MTSNWLKTNQFFTRDLIIKLLIKSPIRLPIKLPIKLPINFISILILAGLTGCDRLPFFQKTANNPTPTPTATIKNELTLSDVTLEQSNEKGQILWKIKSQKATYKKDQKSVLVENPVGELFQDGKLVYTVKAPKGEIFQDGKKVTLKGQIIATDVINKVTLQGQELEWQPEADILIVRKNLIATHEKFQATGQEVIVFSKKKLAELKGAVIVKMQQPIIEIKSQDISWKIDKGLFISKKPTQIDRFQAQKIIASGFADEAEFNYNTKLAILKKNVQLVLDDPNVQVSSQLINWNVEQKSITTPLPVTVWEKQENIYLSGNQGSGDFAKNSFSLVGNVVGVGQQRQSQINCDTLFWQFKDQNFIANGNVLYQQAEPPMKVSAPMATGELKNNTNVTFRGNSSSSVVMEITTNE